MGEVPAVGILWSIAFPQTLCRKSLAVSKDGLDLDDAATQQQQQQQL
jgi:hypothetical protein